MTTTDKKKRRWHDFGFYITN